VAENLVKWIDLSAMHQFGDVLREKTPLINFPCCSRKRAKGCGIVGKAAPPAQGLGELKEEIYL